MIDHVNNIDIKYAKIIQEKNLRNDCKYIK